MFLIEDEKHAETIGSKFTTRQEAISELQRLATIAWDQEPNQAPCQNWRNCGRQYEIVEYDDSVTPWNEISRTLILNTSSKGAIWN